MVLKTFNIDEETYNQFSEFCRQNGISMSKQIDIFIKAQLEEKPKVRKEYLEKLDRIRRGKFIRFNSIEPRLQGIRESTDERNLYNSVHSSAKNI